MTTEKKFVNALFATQDIWDQMTFGSLIRSLRISDDITQVDLAKKLNVSKQFLSDVEHDRKDVGMEFAKKFAKVTGYSIEPLLELLILNQLKKSNLNYSVQLKKAS